MTYTLKPGKYYIGDPAYLIRKTQEGDRFIKQLWQLFYKDMNHFHHLMIDGFELYAFRTEGGDGFFDGIGTDTGVIMIGCLDDLKDQLIFKTSIETHGCKIVDIREETPATVEMFTLNIEKYLTVRTV